MKTALHRRLRDVGPGLRALFPQLFMHRFHLSTHLAPDECIEILKARTCPMSDLGKTWGLKPFFASFEPSRIVLRRHSYSGMKFDPILYASIEQTTSGSLVRCSAACDGIMQLYTLISLVALLLPAFILPSLVLSSEHRPSDLIGGFALMVACPAAGWWLLKSLRKHHEEVIGSYENFLTTSFSARPAAVGVEGNASTLTTLTTLTASIGLGLLISLMGVGLSVALTFIVLKGIFSLYGLLSGFLSGPVIGILLLAALFGSAGLLLFRDPAFRRKPPAAANAAQGESPEGER